MFHRGNKPKIPQKSLWKKQLNIKFNLLNKNALTLLTTVSRLTQYVPAVRTSPLTSTHSPLTPHLKEVLKVRLIVDASLKQRGSVDLRGAEADVGLHVGKLRCQDIAYHLHGRVLSCRLLTSAQRPAHHNTNRSECTLKTAVHDLLIMRKTACVHAIIHTLKVWCCKSATLPSWKRSWPSPNPSAAPTLTSVCGKPAQTHTRRHVAEAQGSSQVRRHQMSNSLHPARSAGLPRSVPPSRSARGCNLVSFSPEGSESPDCSDRHTLQRKRTHGRRVLWLERIL